MGILARLDRQIRNATWKQNEGWLADWARGIESETDEIAVNERTALKISTVYKCVRVRAETFGCQPKKLFERVEVLGRAAQREARQHPLYEIIHTAPNPTITSMDFFQLISADLDLWGNFYAYIERNAVSGRIQHLWRVMPDSVRLDTRTRRGSILYQIRDENGVESPFLADEILHVRGLGYDGIQGYSPIQVNKRALKWNAKAVRASSNFFDNASRPSFIATTKTAIKDPEVKKSLIASLTSTGKEMGRGVLIEGETDIKQLSMNQDDAQFIETVMLQEEDICGIFRVPPHKVMNLRRSTNNNIEHQDIEWVRDSILPICVRVEQAVNTQLLSDAPSSGRGGGTERQRYFMECDLKGLLRGDTAAQTSHIREMINASVYSPNDGRDYLGLSPFEGGDEHWIQLNMVPISIAKELLTQPKERPRPVPEEDDDTVENRVLAELQARFRVAYTHVFRDAVGRVLNRKASERERIVPGVFERILQGLAEGLSVELTKAFSADYLAAMAKRAVEWTSIEETASSEIDRAVRALLEKSE